MIKQPCGVYGKPAFRINYAMSFPDELAIFGPICEACDLAIHNSGYVSQAKERNGFYYAIWVFTDKAAYMELFEQYRVRELLDLI